MKAQLNRKIGKNVRCTRVPRTRKYNSVIYLWENENQFTLFLMLDSSLNDKLCVYRVYVFIVFSSRHTIQPNNGTKKM